MNSRERIAPHSPEAEKSVLGSIMLNKEALFDVLEFLTSDDFYSEMHREIFEAIKVLNKNGSPVDFLTVSEELKKRNSLEMVGGRSYVANLSSAVPSTANALEYAKIIEEKAILRRLINASADIMEESYRENTEPETVLDHAEQSIFKIAQTRQRKDYEHLKEILFSNIKRIDEIAKLEGQLTGISTGFKDLDGLTSGLQKSDLIIVAARPSMGKTAFALNIARHAGLKHGGSVLIFSLEMSREQLGQRFLAIEAKVDMTKIKTGTLERHDWDNLYEAMDALSGSNIYIDDTPGISIMEIRNKCRRLKAEKGLDLVVVDYLQLMSYEGRAESRQQEVTALSRYLKQLAREMECPVMVLSQLSRAPELRSDHRPLLSDLRESGSIEQDADIVMLLYRDDYYNEDSETPNVCDVHIAKHRSGPTAEIQLTWLGKQTRFVDIAKIKD